MKELYTKSSLLLDYKEPEPFIHVEKSWSKLDAVAAIAKAIGTEYTPGDFDEVTFRADILINLSDDAIKQLFRLMHLDQFQE